MKNTNKIISAFFAVFLLLCFVGCDETIKDNNSEPQNVSALQQSETPSNGESNVTYNNKDTQTNSSPDNNIQYLPDDFVNNSNFDGEIESGELEDGTQNDQTQKDNTSQDNNISQSDEKIEYDDNSGWSSGWN